jgi:hypothetical protein
MPQGEPGTADWQPGAQAYHMEQHNTFNNFHAIFKGVVKTF